MSSRSSRHYGGALLSMTACVRSSETVPRSRAGEVVHKLRNLRIDAISVRIVTSDARSSTVPASIAESVKGSRDFAASEYSQKDSPNRPPSPSYRIRFNRWTRRSVERAAPSGDYTSNVR